jgi:hypothetical protein
MQVPLLMRECARAVSLHVSRTLIRRLSSLIISENRSIFYTLETWMNRSSHSASPMLLLLHPVHAYNEQSSCCLTIRGSIPLLSILMGGHPLFPYGKAQSDV